MNSLERTSSVLNHLTLKTEAGNHYRNTISEVLLLIPVSAKGMPEVIQVIVRVKAMREAL